MKVQLARRSTLLGFFAIGVLLIVSNSIAQAQTAFVPDTVFRNMLSKKYPTIIDQNGRLIIAEAAKIAGVINGSNLAITSIEGIQYFTGAQTISFVRTGLSTIPDLSSLVNLQGINLMYNKITTLPSLKNLKRLKVLNVHSNSLSTLPDLSRNDSLVEINANSNFLDSIPDLSKLTQLQRLYVHNNRISKLSGIDKLISLVEFWCYSNRLGNFPILDKLKNIKNFDASKNLLTAAPDFGAKSGIKVIDIDMNDISFLPDYTKYDSLKKVRIEYNRLTFSELSKIIPIKRYDTIFQISPQKILTIGKPIALAEGNSFTFSTNIDLQEPTVRYTWFRNGTKTATISGDKWTITKVLQPDSGMYTAQLSHPAFANFNLQTDAFKVSVVPCINMNYISFISTGVTCQKSGSLEVLVSAGNKYEFELKSLGSGKVFASANGKFEGLSEPLYGLIIRNATGCVKTYPQEIKIPVQKCLDYLLTPNNDGNADTFFFEASGKVEIYDKWGTLVKRMNTPAEWDCTTDKGKVPNGYYIANVNDGESHIGLSVVY